jgi:DNA mismatch endonuclease (patch repair protein)
MQRQPRSGTAPELALRRALHRRGLRYRLQVEVLPGLRRRPDVVFRRARVAVEVYGCYWHACPEHGTQPKANGAWWAAKLAANVERDLDTARRLRSAGWELLVVWEHEDSEVAADRVAAFVTARHSNDQKPSQEDGQPSQEGAELSDGTP